MNEMQLDARNMLCPLPVIKLQNAARNLTSGDTIVLLCTDPGTLQDIPCWCRIYRHHILSQEQQEYEIKFTIQVG